jgi:hypothetical protein
VKVEELKKILKRVKKDYRLALDLYATGIYDAMYLAGLIADDAKMTREDLRAWQESSRCDATSSWTVAWVAAGSPHGWEMGLEWIESPNELTAIAGWSTLSSLVGIRPDADLDLDALKGLLERVGETIHQQPDRVRYSMNGFVIAVGTYVEPLTELALEIGRKVGTVQVDMGKTACKVPFAPDYIEKVRQRGAIGRKRKSAKC